MEKKLVSSKKLASARKVGHLKKSYISKWKHGNSRECEAEPEKQARKIEINLEKAKIFWGGSLNAQKLHGV